MLTIRLLVLGDIHFPSSARKRRLVDDKDEAFPTALRDNVSETPLKAVVKQAVDVLNQTDISAVLLVGDLTDYGNLAHFDSCAQYLRECLLVTSTDRHKAPSPVVWVPGNHDVNRELAKRPGYAAKFAPLSKTMIKNGFDASPLDAVSSKRLESGAAHAQLITINSCWGCGTLTEAPTEFVDGLKRTLDEKLDGASDVLALEQYYDRQLDSPAFAIGSLKALSEMVKSLARTCFPVVLSHHNLLPQRLTRLAPYTELINSGSLRSTLLECQHPVIYIHGHTHDELIETIGTPEGGKIIAISSPHS